MAKEFKHFDLKYAKLAGGGLNYVAKRVGLPPISLIEGISGWPYLHRFTESYGTHKIRYAVYEAPRAEQWQMFRVSLKGLSTRQKLFCLGWYWDYNIAPDIAGSGHDPDDIIRVNNYLGALKRSGHLDSNLKVVK